MLQHKQQLEAQQLQLKAQQEECHIDTELKKAQAREQVLANEQSESNVVDITCTYGDEHIMHVPMSVNSPFLLQNSATFADQTIICSTAEYQLTKDGHQTSVTTTAPSSSVMPDPYALVPKSTTAIPEHRAKTDIYSQIQVPPSSVIYPIMPDPYALVPKSTTTIPEHRAKTDIYSQIQVPPSSVIYPTVTDPHARVPESTTAIPEHRAKTDIYSQIQVPPSSVIYPTVTDPHARVPESTTAIPEHRTKTDIYSQIQVPPSNATYPRVSDKSMSTVRNRS